MNRGPGVLPTRLRSTAMGFTTGTASAVTSFGPPVAALMVGAFGGSFNKITAFMTCFALLSIVAMFLGRETRHTGLLHQLMRRPLPLRGRGRGALHATRTRGGAQRRIVRYLPPPLMRSAIQPSRPPISPAGGRGRGASCSTSRLYR
jgi:hypothetical protein